MNAIGLLLGCLLLMQTVMADNSQQVETLKKLLADSAYNKLILPPKEDGAAVNVSLSFYPISMEVNTKKDQFTVNLYFRQKWTDTRFRRPEAEGAITLNDPSQIWTPDLFFANSIDSRIQKQLNPECFVRLNATGEIFISKRLTLKLLCPMDLTYFPFDKQICSMEIESYGYSNKDLDMFWDEKLTYEFARYNHLATREFVTTSVTSNVQTIRLTTGNYTRARVHFALKRQQGGYYMLHVFIPCTMLIILSWFGFYVPIAHLQTRVQLQLLILLTLFLFVVNLNTDRPVANYTTALDVWTGCCLTFVFVALLETFLVARLYGCGASRECKLKQLQQHHQRPLLDEADSKQEAGEIGYSPVDKSNTRQRTGLFGKLQQMRQKASNPMDLLARILFPLVYLLFIILYLHCYVCH